MSTHEDKMPPPERRPCWAFNRQRQRCTLFAGHEDDHAIAVTWTDDECFDPTEVPALPVSPISLPIPGVTQTATDRCFSCECPRVIHHEGGCEAHGCKTFID